MRLTLLSLTLFVTSLIFADARVSQKTQVQFGGVLGSAVNIFGGKAAREGMTSDVSVVGDRKITRNGDTAEIVDLKEEKIYNVDYAKKTYKVTTFAELRKKFEDARKQAAEERDEEKESSKKKDPDAKEYEVDFDVKATGKKETINGFETKQTIATVTVREKGKTLKQAGGSVLTADMWLAPRVAALKEVEDFDRRYVKKLWAELGMDMRSFAALAAMSPEFSKAMKKLQEKAADGSPIRTGLNFEVVPDPRAKASAEEEEGQSASTAAVAALGGLMNRMKKKRASEEPAKEAEKPATTTAGGKMLFNSKTEVLEANGSASKDDVAIPKTFKLTK